MGVPGPFLFGGSMHVTIAAFTVDTKCMCDVLRVTTRAPACRWGSQMVRVT